MKLPNGLEIEPGDVLIWGAPGKESQGTFLRAEDVYLIIEVGGDERKIPNCAYKLRKVEGAPASPAAPSEAGAERRAGAHSAIA